MSWFDDLSPKAQKAYIAKHPTSKYASGKSKSNEKDRRKAVKAGKKLLGRKIDLTPKSLKNDKKVRELQATIRILKRTIAEDKKAMNELVSPVAIKRAEAWLKKRKDTLKDLTAKLVRLGG